MDYSNYGNLSKYALQAQFDGEVEIHGITVSCVVDLEIRLTATDERTKYEAEIESAGFSHNSFITSFSPPPYVHIPNAFLDSRPEGSDCTWRDLIIDAAYKAVESANAWQRVDLTED